MEEAAQELAASVAGVTSAYEQPRQARRVAETEPVAPIEKEGLEWQSLWE